MEDADIDFVSVKPEKKRRKFWIPLLCGARVAAVAASGVWYLFLRDGGADGYYGYLMQEVYGNVGDAAQNDAFSSRYLTRFGALYGINDDVIATLTVPELHVALPVVSAAGKGDFYRYHRFDGTLALYGTPYVTAAYSETDVNPNLVIRGGSLLEPLNRLGQGSGAVTIKTDSILFGEDTWEILSVMALDDDALVDYEDTFAALTAEQRQARAKAALRASLRSTGRTEADLENVGLSTNFLTLTTPCTFESGKTLVVFARRAADAAIETTTPDAEPASTEATTSDETTQTVSTADEQE